MIECRWCKNDIVPIVEKGWSLCPECEGVSPEGYKRNEIDVPLKGSDKWYKEKWYMKSEKHLNDELKSRHTLNNGKTVFRVDNNGKRIG